MNRRNVRLPPEVNRAIYVRNLPFNITSEEMYDIFGKYGAIRQIRIGVTKETRGTAFVVYEDIYDAKTAVEHLSGFNVANRYLIVLYYQQAKFTKKIDQAKFTKKIDQQPVQHAYSHVITAPLPPAPLSVPPLFFRLPSSLCGSFWGG
ncbi:unnamed protein product [Closterium sp. Naga37s-1]|nr:unnamed protein product [Closterium sp. Naga37s-1]